MKIAINSYHLFDMCDCSIFSMSGNVEEAKS